MKAFILTLLRELRGRPTDRCVACTGWGHLSKDCPYNGKKPRSAWWR